jgi:serine/threonine-protein kinase RsbW
MAAGIEIEESAEELYEEAPCGYLSTLPDGTIMRANRTFLAWTGHAREEVVGQVRFQDLLTTGGRIFHETHIAPLLRMQGAVRELAVDVRRPSADPLPALLNVSAVIDDDGEHVLNRLTLLDATNRRDYERELLRERRRAEQSEARLGALNSIMASLVNAPGLEQVTEELAQAGTTRFGASRSEVWLLSDDRYWLSLRAFSGPKSPAHERYAIAATDSTPKTRALRGSDVLLCPRPDNRTVVLVPLDGEEGQIGVLSLEFAHEPGDEDTQTLRALGRIGGQALERARAHWQLRRISEVLPICMDCEVIRPDREWISIVEYFKQNSLLLSHGLCPTCSDRREAELSDR